MTPIAWTIFLSLLALAAAGMFGVLRLIVRYPSSVRGPARTPIPLEDTMPAPLPALPVSVREPAPRGSLPPGHQDLIPCSVSEYCADDACSFASTGRMPVHLRARPGHHRRPERARVRPDPPGR